MGDREISTINSAAINSVFIAACRSSEQHPLWPWTGICVTEIVRLSFSHLKLLYLVYSFQFKFTVYQNRQLSWPRPQFIPEFIPTSPNEISEKLKSVGKLETITTKTRKQFTHTKMSFEKFAWLIYLGIGVRFECAENFRHKRNVNEKIMTKKNHNCTYVKVETWLKCAYVIVHLSVCSVST